jgi:hypothetical protein
MPVELEITELNEYQRANVFIDSMLDKDKYVTLNMIKRLGIRQKIAKRVLRTHKNTMLCDPLEFGSNKFSNEKLYKIVSNDELIQLCNDELTNLRKNKKLKDSNFESYINSGLNYRMMNKYNASIAYPITSKLK